MRGNSVQSPAVLRALSGAGLVGFKGNVSNSVGRTVEARLSEVVSIKDFGAVGDGVTNDSAALLLAGNSGKMVYFPDGEYLDSDGLLSFAQNCAFVGYNVPLYDEPTGWKAGAWIKGVVGVGGARKSVAFKNLGFDSSASATSEGVTITNTSGQPPVENVYCENLVIIGKTANNHNLLIENANNVYIKNITTYSGIQGVAVKATNFYIEDIKGVDNITWALTLRESSGAICRHGTVRRVRTQAVNNPTCGGVVLMNSTQGEAATDITFDDINLDSGYFFIDNTNNTVGATDIRLNNLIITGRSGYALQTFGPVDGFKVSGATFNSCGGGIYTNGDTSCKNYELSNFTFNATTVGAQLEGVNHIAHGWKKGDSGPSNFILNYSIDLQVYNMDKRSKAVTNTGGGNTINSSGVVNISANGSIPAREWYPSYSSRVVFGSVSQNDYVTLYTLPSGGSRCNLLLNIYVFSVNGRHLKTVAISDTNVEVLVNSASANTVFAIDRSSDLIRLRYLQATTSDLQIIVTGSIEHEQ